MLGKSFSCWTTQEIRWRSIKIQHCDNVILKMLPNIKASVKQWPWTKSLQVHCLAHLLKPQWDLTGYTQGEGTQVSRYQITQWWHRADTPKMSTSRAGTTRTPSQRRCWLIHSTNTPPHTPGFVTLGTPTLLPAPKVPPVWWEPTRWFHPPGQGLT